MIIAANIAFAIAAVFLGQLFVLRRRAAPAVAVLRFAPNFDAAPDGALHAPEQQAAAVGDIAPAPVTTMPLAEPVTDAATRTDPVDTEHTTLGGDRDDDVDPHLPENLWPWQRRARAVIDRAFHLSPVPDIPTVAPVVEAQHEIERPEPVAQDVMGPVSAHSVEPEPPITELATPVTLNAHDDDDADDHTPPLLLEAPILPPVAERLDADGTDDEEAAAAAEIALAVRPAPWWRRFIPRRAAAPDPLAVHGLHLDEDEAEHAVIVARDEEPVSAPPPVTAAAAEDDLDDEDAPLLSDSLGLSPERRAQLAAERASVDAHEAEPVAASTIEPAALAEPVAVEEPVVAAEPAAVASVTATTNAQQAPEDEPLGATAADAARALAEAQMRASAWACEATGSRQPIPVDKRRRLLEYYAATIDDATARNIIARVEREDPDLSARAAEILRQAAA